MKKRYLIDTCIWRDFYENRFSKSGKPFGEYASKMFLKILKNKGEILFSEALIWELGKYFGDNEIGSMLDLFYFNGVLIKIEIKKHEAKEAKILSKKRNIPFVDCLLVIQAQNYNAILVTQDKHILNQLKDIVKAIKPQEVN